MINVTIIVLVVYLLIMFGVALYFSRNESFQGYFLNKRKTSLWMLTFSNVSTLVGAGATVAIVAEVYNTGIGYGLVLPFGFLVGALLFAFFAKKIREQKVYSIAEFFGNKFGEKNLYLVAVLQLIFLFVWTAIQALAFASLASVLIGINFKLAIVIVSLITVIYTAIGGLKIDIISDFIQFWIIFVVLAVVTGLSLNSVGGLTQLIGSLPEGHLNPFNFGGVVWFFGGIVLSGFILLPGSYHWQRISSAKSNDVAKKSFLYSIPFLILISFFSLIMGLTASVLLNVEKSSAIFSLMEVLLSPVFFGIGLAAILAVIMSSIDSLLIGGSTIIVRSFLKSSSVLIGRIVTAAFGIVGFLVAYMIPNIVTLSLFQSYFALVFIPPIFAGFFSKRIKPNAIFYSLLIPFIFLVLFFSLIGKNIFLINLILGILILNLWPKKK